MAADDELPLGRRALLTGVGLTAGALLAGGFGRLGLLGPAAPAPSLSPEALLRALHGSLSEAQRKLICFAADHPSRQLTNTGAIIERPGSADVLDPAQRALSLRLFQLATTATGPEPWNHLLGGEASGLDACLLGIYGEPGAPDCQLMWNGPHLLHRGGMSLDPRGVVFGGPLAYGHQTGNQRYRLPGNAFASHAEAANALYAALSPAERAQARLPKAPFELLVQLQDADGTFTGVRLGSLSEAAQERAATLLGAVLDMYSRDAAAAARSAIEHNGGLAQLHVTLYDDLARYPDLANYGELPDAERARRGEPFFQSFRIEGPGTIIHFKGFPHVHAYVHIARDARRQHVGEVLAETTAQLEGDALRPLLEQALREHTGEPYAFYGGDVLARLCPGPITVGTAWNLDPFANHVVVATIAESALSPALRKRLAAQGAALPKGGQRYRVATSDYLAGHREEFGAVERVDPGPAELREVVVAHLRKHGLRFAG